MSDQAPPLVWHKVAEPDELADGRVRAVVAGHRSIALTRCNGSDGALDNRCPHQGGPLGEGSIEKGWLRCPWHGYDYDPITGSWSTTTSMAGGPGHLCGRPAHRWNGACVRR